MPDSSHRCSCLLPLPALFAFTQQAGKAVTVRRKAVTQEVRLASREGIRQVNQAKRQQVNGGAGRQMNKKIGEWVGGWVCVCVFGCVGVCVCVCV